MSSTSRPATQAKSTQSRRGRSRSWPARIEPCDLRLERSPPAESVDVFVDLFPEVCLGCAVGLPEALDSDLHRYQRLDLRDHRPHLTEYRQHEAECRTAASTSPEELS